MLIIKILLKLYLPISFAIVGGELVTQNDPVAKSTVGLSMGCTGTLISPRHVLTAAHCISGRPFEVLFGNNFNQAFPIEASQVIRHPDYNQVPGPSPSNPPMRPSHDIALIKLSQPAPKDFQPVPMGSPINIFVGDTLLLAGFGQTNPATGSGFGRLRKVETLFNFYNEPALEIVFGPTPGKSACRGDSGGPMYLEYRDKLYVIGVTSRGFPQLGPCSGNGNYTDIEAHFDWIQETLDELS